MKDEFKLIAWFVSGTFRFIFALLIIFGVFFGCVYLFVLAQESSTGHIIFYTLCSLAFLFSGWCFYIAYQQHRGKMTKPKVN